MRRCGARGTRVAARAFVVTDAEASMHLVPGGGACEAALFAAARAAAARRDGGVIRKRKRRPRKRPRRSRRRRWPRRIKATRARESDAAALDVLCAMARAVPDALASTGRDDRGASDGIPDILDPGSTVQSVGRSSSSSAARRTSRLGEETRDWARDFFGGLTKKSRSFSRSPRQSDARVRGGRAGDGNPGTAAAILDETRRRRSRRVTRR